MSQEQRLEHELLLKIFETSPIAIVVANRDGVVYLANTQAEKTLHLTRKDITKRVYDDPEWIITGFDGKEFPSGNLPFNQVKAGGKAVFNIQHAISMGNGARIFLNINAAPLFNDHGEFDGMVASLDDITERKQMEERIRHSEKMKAVGQLAGGIAHDFNNQLTGIMGFADLIREQVRNNGAMSRYINNILVCGRRAADLTNHLLAFARKGKYLSVSVDIHHLIGEAASMLERGINKNIIIEQDLKAHPSTTRGDPSQLQNSLLNLGLNARDAMPEGGKLTLATEVVEVNGPNENRMIFDIAPGAYVKVSVGDTGIGIAPAIFNRIFEPFFTTKEEGRGTGFGLAAVYGTVKNHHGGIAVRSKPGEGTVFSLFLPLAQDDAGSAPDAGAADMDQVFAGKHVLVVDDEEPIRQLGSALMESIGCRVTVCNDGKEAVEIYRRMGKEIDVVILDIVMPNMDGIAAFRALKELNPRIQVLLSSGYSIEGDAQQLIKEGAADFLQKPFRKTDLIVKLSGLLRKTPA